MQDLKLCFLNFKNFNMFSASVKPCCSRKRMKELIEPWLRVKFCQDVSSFGPVCKRLAKHVFVFRDLH